MVNSHLGYLVLSVELAAVVDQLVLHCHELVGVDVDLLDSSGILAEGGLQGVCS